MFDYLSNEVFGLVTIYELLLTFHLVGLALGAGAAFFSDFLFSYILKDKKISLPEYGILKLASTVVWIGLCVLVATGILIFLGDTERLLASSKFLAKMTIVFILFINGVLFHFKQIPMLYRFTDIDLSKDKEFKSKYASPFFIGGAVSGVSWMAALVLGSITFVDLSYFAIIAIYLAALFVSIPVSLQLKKHFLS